MNKIEKLTLTLIDAAGALGLSEFDLTNAKAFSDKKEYGLASYQILYLLLVK